MIPCMIVGDAGECASPTPLKPVIHVVSRCRTGCPALHTGRRYRIVITKLPVGACSDTLSEPCPAPHVRSGMHALPKCRGPVRPTRGSRLWGSRRCRPQAEHRYQGGYFLGGRVRRHHPKVRGTTVTTAVHLIILSWVSVRSPTPATGGTARIGRSGRDVPRERYGRITAGCFHAFWEGGTPAWSATAEEPGSPHAGSPTEE